MDTLYTGDIPSNYHYARFNSNYIDLYGSDYIPPYTQFTYYRVYMYDNYFAYDTYTSTTGAGGASNFKNIITTDNVLYRRDMPLIAIWTFVLIVAFVFIINIVTSFIKKGGVFGGLL